MPWLSALVDLEDVASTLDAAALGGTVEPDSVRINLTGEVKGSSVTLKAMLTWFLTAGVADTGWAQSIEDSPDASSGIPSGADRVSVHVIPFSKRTSGTSYKDKVLLVWFA